MARGDAHTPFYIRTLEGETFYVDTIEEALTEFMSDVGYRLTLETEDNSVSIKRSAESRGKSYYREKNTPYSEKRKYASYISSTFNRGLNYA